MQHTITAVSTKTREYQTKFGDMVSYRLKLTGTEDDVVVELSKKKSSPAPKVGDVLEGTIDFTGQYGPKFKQEYGGGFGGSGSSHTARQGSGGYGAAKQQNDPFTMYLSYAKDIAVALVGTKEGFNAEKFDELISHVESGGKALYYARPGAPKEDVPTEPKSKDVVPEDVDDVVDLSSVEEMMADSKPVDLADIPF